MAPTFRAALSLALTATVLACGGSAAPGQLVSGELLKDASSDLSSTNGMSTNGMSTNGMSTNGMSTNGLGGNGLLLAGSGASGIAAGLTNAVIGGKQFHTWFQSNNAYSNMVMTYVVRCAVPAGQTRTYTNGSTSYTWQGELGLAPLWSLGLPISTLEQQLISACMGAHTNRFGVHVDFSVVGMRGDGSVLPFQSGEQSLYPIAEGAFFGNLFNGGTVYSCSMGTTDTDGVSGPRECAMSDMPSSVCAPLVNTQQPCWSMCTGANLPGIGWTYVSCTGLDGRSYPPVNTAVGSSSIYWCGDGTCQFTESCYDSSSKTGCLADCGRCQ